MRVWRQSPVTGKRNSMEIDVTGPQLDQIMYSVRKVEEIVSSLPAQHVEFLKSGKTIREQQEENSII